MSTETGMRPAPQNEDGLVDTGIAGTTDAHKKKLTFTEHVIVMVKILGTFALVGAAIWGLDAWVAP